MKYLIFVLLLCSACSLVSREEVERRFVLKSDLDNLIIQANSALAAQSGAIKELQAKQVEPQAPKTKK